MANIQEWFKGKKTYLVAVVTIIGTVVAWSQGQIDIMTAIQTIIGAIMGCTIRAGIKTETEK